MYLLDPLLILVRNVCSVVVFRIRDAGLPRIPRNFNTFSCSILQERPAYLQSPLVSYIDVHLSALHSRGKEIFIGGIFIFGLLCTADSALAQMDTNGCFH